MKAKKYKNSGKKAPEKKIATKAVLYRKGNIQFLVKAGGLKHTLQPLSQDKKDAIFPNIDSFSKSDLRAELGLLNGIDLFPLDDAKTKKDGENLLKKSSTAKKTAAILALCSAPKQLADTRSGYIVLLISMLARINSFVPSSIIAETPAVSCGDLTQSPPYLNTILSAVNGPSRVRGSNYTLKRPSCIEEFRPFPGTPAPSHSLHSYLGGTLKMNAKDYNIWVPLWNRAVSFAPGLPQTVQENILSSSPSIIPFYCNGTKPKGNWVISIKGDLLFMENSDGLSILQQYLPLIQAIIEKFFRKQTKKASGCRAMFDGIEKLYPSFQVGNLSASQPTTLARILAAALCVYRAFLSFACDKQWISEDQYTSLLTEAQNVIFPHNASDVKADSLLTVGTWDSPTVFWPFFTDFLRENALHICADTPCAKDAVAAVHTLKNQADPLLIVPRNLIETAYHAYCDLHGLYNDWEGRDLSAAILTFHQRLKTRSDCKTWPFSFYRNGHSPSGKDGLIPCLGFVLADLPDDIQTLLSRMVA